MNAPRSGCPINLPLEALGDRWSLIVIRDLMFGNRRHFRELLTRSEERIASNILADRLTRLEKAGLVSLRDDPCLDNRILLMRQTKTDRRRRIYRSFLTPESALLRQRGYTTTEHVARSNC